MRGSLRTWGRTIGHFRGRARPVPTVLGVDSHGVAGGSAREWDLLSLGDVAWVFDGNFVCHGVRVRESNQPPASTSH